MEAAEPSPRESALAFTEGVRCGWLASDLIVWVEEHLVAARRIGLPAGVPLKGVREAGAGVVTLAGPFSHRSGERVRTASHVPQLLASARDRVLDALRTTVASGETRFVNAALYAGRVSRERDASGTSRWVVWLSPDDNVSDHVLALFAADALTFPRDYEHDLCVCEACGAVSFGSNGTSRRGCLTHPYGSFDGKPSHDDRISLART